MLRLINKLPIFMHLQEIRKCKIVQNAHDMKKHIKYQKYSAFYNI